jgi:putative tricarboxylic transport membrane protein
MFNHAPVFQLAAFQQLYSQYVWQNLDRGTGDMKNLDKWIAAFFLVVTLAYAYSTVTYQLLPFERYMVFLPTTLPSGLAIISALLCLLIILTPSQQTQDSDPEAEDAGIAKYLKQYEVGQALYLILAMIAFALALRPIGFLATTTLFLISTGWILGERKLKLMIPIAAFSAFSIWYLVQETLGLYLRPLPWFLS